MIEFILDFVQQLHWTANWGEIARTLLRCDPGGDTRFLCNAAQILDDVLGNRQLFTGSASSEVAAGLATHGYYLQERISDMITGSDGELFGLAPLLYLLSGIGGLIMLALGAPPKLYLWFLMGPGLFWVLLSPANRTESAGNLYMIGRRIMPQDEVQRIAALGENDFGLNFFSVTGPTGRALLTYNDPASVSWLFATIDTAVSGIVRGLEAAFTPVVTVEFPGGGQSESLWHSIANSRWSILESITSARISQADIRDLFVTFMSSECRGTLSKYLNYAAYLSAKSGRMPESIFDPRADVQQNPQVVLNDLANTVIPVPLSMRGLVNDVLRGAVLTNNTNPRATIGFSLFGNSNPPAFRNIFNSTRIQCNSFLHILMAAIRAEAGYQYAKIMEASPRLVFRFSEDSSNPTAGLIDALLQPVAGGPMSALELTREIFGYWNLPGEIFNDSFSVGSLNLNFGLGAAPAFNRALTALNIQPDAEQQAQQFLIDIITAHIFQNELKFMPPLVVDNGIDNREYAKAASQSIGSVGATTKFGEIYVWAKMLPQVQGLALMLLAAMFPIAVVLMVAPNFHKALLTWTLFFVWVKSWDVGFTLVKRIEPVLWSFVGKSDSLAESITRTMQFSASSLVTVACDVQRGTPLAEPSAPPCGETETGVDTIPISIVRSPETGTGGILRPVNEEEALHTLDVGLSVQEAFNLAEGNAFYIYLMSALYFSVPVLLGQLILGSKAAMANILRDFTGQITSDGSRAAGQAYSAQRQAQASATAASFNQAEMLKNMREQGLAERAIQAQNLSLRNQVDSALKGQIAQGMRTQTEMASLGLDASQRLSQGFMNRQLWPVIVGGNQARQAGMGAGGAAAQMLWINDLVSRLASQQAQEQSSDVDAFAKLFGEHQALDPRDAIAKMTLSFTNSARAMLGESGYAMPNPRPPSAGANQVPRNPQATTRTNQRPAGLGLDGQLARTNGEPSGRTAFEAAGEARLQPHGFAGNNQSPVVHNPAGSTPQPDWLPNHTTPNTDGSSPTDGNGLSRLTGAIQQQVFYYINAAQQLYSLPRDQGISLVGAEVTERRAYATAVGQSLGIEGFRHSQDSAAFGQSSQRLSSAANFEAQSATWLARTNYANAVSATLSAYGVSPQTVSPGEKPTDYMGAAWLGQLGESSQNQARYVDNTSRNSIFQEIRADTAGLLSNYSDIRMYETFLSTKMTPETLMGLGLASMMSKEGLMDAQVRQRLNQIPVPSVGSNP